nr:hypothetical protein [Larsenimonas rhizosphaerae]
MFGDWIVSRAWGQIGTQFGGLKHMLADSRTQAMMWVDDINHIQLSRHFRKVLETQDHTPEARDAMRQLSLLDQ